MDGENKKFVIRNCAMEHPGFIISTEAFGKGFRLRIRDKHEIIIADFFFDENDEPDGIGTEFLKGVPDGD